jgi:hypothetical protein
MLKTDLQALSEVVAEEVSRFSEQSGRQLHLEIEPGAFLVANTGSLVTTTQDMSDTGPDVEASRAGHVCAVQSEAGALLLLIEREGAGKRLGRDLLLCHRRHNLPSSSCSSGAALAMRRLASRVHTSRRVSSFGDDSYPSRTRHARG